MRPVGAWLLKRFFLPGVIITHAHVSFALQLRALLLALLSPAHAVTLPPVARLAALRAATAALAAATAPLASDAKGGPFAVWLGCELGACGGDVASGLGGEAGPPNGMGTGGNGNGGNGKGSGSTVVGGLARLGTLLRRALALCADPSPALRAASLELVEVILHCHGRPRPTLWRALVQHVMASSPIARSMLGMRGLVEP